MLEGLIRSGFTITGTWPVSYRKSWSNSQHWERGKFTCLLYRPRLSPTSSRCDFCLTPPIPQRAKSKDPPTLKQMQHGSIAPVDLAQASIGPGMAIFTRAIAKVL